MSSQPVNSLSDRSQVVHATKPLFSWVFLAFVVPVIGFVVVVWEFLKGVDQVRVLYNTPSRRHAPCCRIIISRRRTKASEKRFHYPRPCSTITRYLFLKDAALHTRMMHTTFKEWLARRDEGLLLPDRRS